MAVAALSAEFQQIQRSDRVLRSGVDVVAVTATVLDAEGRLATGLPREAFEVYEDGEPQTITQFTNERVPVGLGVLLDMSDSMYGQRIVDARAAVERFLFDLLQKEDEFFVLAFNHYPHILTRWTSNPEDIRVALTDIKPSGGTAIYDAVVGALPMIGRRTRERAALVVISDGADTASDITVSDVRTSLLRSEAFVYAIAIDSPKRQAINTRVNAAALGEITGQSGGRTEVVQDMDGIAGGHRAHRRGAQQPVRDGLRIPARDRRQVPQHPRPRRPAWLQSAGEKRLRRYGQTRQPAAVIAR